MRDAAFELVEQTLRAELWLGHGCSRTAVYGDDGEMQCGQCMFDFKRSSIIEVINHAMARRLMAASERHPLLLADPLTGADCYFCGQTADNFHVDDEVWAQVEAILGQHQACFKCFRIAAWSVGLRSGWEVIERGLCVDYSCEAGTFPSDSRYEGDLRIGAGEVVVRLMYPRDGGQPEVFLGHGAVELLATALPHRAHEHRAANGS